MNVQTTTMEDALREAMAATAPPRGRAQWTTYAVPRPRIDHALVVHLKQMGMTNREIANTVFCEVPTVQEILRQHRLRGEAAARDNASGQGRAA